MKKPMLLLLLLPVALHAQVCDDFENGLPTGWYFNLPGRWDADAEDPVSGNLSLHHIFDNNVQGEDMAAIPISGLSPELGDVNWRFRLRYGCDPSSSNRWGVYLMSDSPPASMAPGSDVSGYVLGVNIRGYDDTLRLWISIKGELTPVVNTGINWQLDIGTDSAVYVSVTRSAGGGWQTEMLNSNGEVMNSASGFRENLFGISYSGIYYCYTSTRDRMIWLDDFCITGIFVVDTEPPSVKSAKFTGRSAIEIGFSEPLNTDNLLPEDFVAEPGDRVPVLIEPLSQDMMKLIFDEPFENKTTWSVTAIDICDIAGNRASLTFTDILLAYPEFGDVIISEIMADPDPAVELPPSEYIEVFNRTDYSFDISALMLSVGDDVFSPEGGTILPQEYAIVCNDNDSLLFAQFGKTIPVRSFGPLKNEADIIIITDSASNLIHGVEYGPAWSNSSLKSQGGWSYEIRDSNFPFSGTNNWAYSNNSAGGTPGKVNSVRCSNPDIVRPVVRNVFPVNDTTINIIFSETVIQGDDLPSVTGGEEVWVRGFIPTGRLLKSYDILISDPLLPGTIYSLNLPAGITDGAGNPPESNWYMFGLPEKAIGGDLVFNEVLFDPLPWEAEFIEFYNVSDRILDAASLFCLLVNSETGDTGKPGWLSEAGRCILPGEYFVITDNKELLLTRYPFSVQENIFEPGYMPVMPDDEGELCLYNRNLDLIDRFHYSAGMHFDLISSPQGVSLERISPLMPANDPGNWHSASALSGWATPGMQNSASDYFVPETNSFALSSRKISPDNDGFEDILRIQFSFNDLGNSVTVMIYDDRGYPVRRLIENYTSGYDDSVSWDGTDDYGHLTDEGIYIIYIRVISAGGKINIWKDVCTVVRQIPQSF